MSDDKPDNKDGEGKLPTEDDIKKINDDIKKTQAAVVSKETEKVIEEEKKKAVDQALKEVEVKKLMETKETENAELKKKLEEQEKKSAEQIGNIQKKVDEMVSSKSTSTGDNPFNTDNNDSSKGVKGWSEEKVNDTEEASARAFFGESYEDCIR